MMQSTKYLLPLTLFAACASVPSDRNVSFESIARGSQSGVTAPGAHVARNADEWRALWSRHSSIGVSPADAPHVDFTSRMVVFVSDGQRPSAGWSLGIDCACVEKGELVLCARTTAPDPNLLQAQVITAPFEIITTDRTDLPIRVQVTRDVAK